MNPFSAIRPGWHFIYLLAAASCMQEHSLNHQTVREVPSLAFQISNFIASNAEVFLNYVLDNFLSSTVPYYLFLKLLFSANEPLVFSSKMLSFLFYFTLPFALLPVRFLKVSLPILSLFHYAVIFKVIVSSVFFLFILFCFLFVLCWLKFAVAIKVLFFLLILMTGFNFLIFYN